MKSLSVAYITARKEPHFDWFFDSLKRELKGAYAATPKIIVDLYAKERPLRVTGDVLHVEPKPNVWQGAHRLTKEDFWAKSNACNTAICMCETEWIAFIDDRSVILPGWLKAIQRAMQHGYAVCGTYEKVDNLTVNNGVIRYKPHRDGKDHRRGNPKGPVKAPGSWWLGCNTACPLEWALTVNGYDEICDGLGFEDVWFGVMLANNGLPVMFDQSMKILEDRTAPQDKGEAKTYIKHYDKGVSPNDKSHKIVELLSPRKRTMHQWDLRKVREQWMRTGEWPIPTGPDRDWWDGQKLSEM